MRRPIGSRRREAANGNKRNERRRAPGSKYRKNRDERVEVYEALAGAPNRIPSSRAARSVCNGYRADADVDAVNDSPDRVARYYGTENGIDSRRKEFSRIGTNRGPIILQASSNPYAPLVMKLATRAGNRKISDSYVL